MWNLQAAGRGFGVQGAIAARARTAYEHVIAAQSALAEQNFSESEQRFGEAHELLTEARAELNQALAASRVILETADLTGRVRSGDRLLEAGELVTEAGQHIVRGLEPLTFKSGGTAVSALIDARSNFRPAHEALLKASEALEDVNASVVPMEVRAQVVELQRTVPKVTTALGTFLEHSEFFLSILGAEHDRQYLLLFQNNHEIRPTGGFIGSLALINVKRGVVEDIDVQTVYDGDGQLKEFIAPPEPLRSITNRWYLRDANWFADFEVSAAKIAHFFEKEGGPTVDGVIAITPEVIKELLVLTGPIEVPQYGVTVTAESFVQITQEQVTYQYDKAANRPKQFLADLTPLLLNRLMSLKQSAALPAAQGLTRLLQEKHILMYLRDHAEQERIRALNFTGNFPKDEPQFLSVVNANIGGHKSDQFIEQEIDYRLAVNEGGETEAVVTIRRTHHGPTEALDTEYPEGENPAFKDNIVYQRVFVPKGAELLEARGFASAAEVPKRVVDEPDIVVTPDPDVVEWQRVQTRGQTDTVIGQEAGYTYFGNWFITKPGATTVALYRYRLPMKLSLPSTLRPAQPWRVFVAKQPGDMRTMVRVEVRLPSTVRLTHTVPHDGITQTSAHELVYRGALTHDQLLGAVLTE